MSENTNKDILFVCDYYYPNPTSIGLCVHKVAKEFLNRGYNVSVLCYGDKSDWDFNFYEGINIFHVKRKIGEQLIYLSKQGKSTPQKKIYGKLGLIILRIQQLLFFHWFRLSSLSSPYRYYKKIKEIYRENPFKILCSSHAPFDGTLASYWFKKAYPDVIFEMYILDSLTNKGNTKWVSAETNDKKGWKWEQKFFRSADLILNIKCNELHNQQKRYEIFRGKMFISDIPLLDNQMLNNKSFIKPTLPQSVCILIYAGRLLSHLSSPDYLCKLLELIAQDITLKMYFYSSGDCEEIIKKLNSNIFIYAGLVNHEKLLELYANSDILVSIGSKRADMLPSKIFEYMSTGKKILHIAKEYDDICLEHYTKYPQALVLFEKDSVETNAIKLLKFINTTPISVNRTDLKVLFKENTPAYTVDIMESGAKTSLVK